MLKLSVALMNAISYKSKMALIAMVFLVPLIISFTLLMMTLTEGITASKKEQQGFQYILTVSRLYQNLPQHRGMTNAYRNGNLALESRILDKREEIAADITAITAINNELGQQFDSGALWADIQNDWADLQQRAFSAPAEEVFNDHSRLVAKLYQLIEHVSYQSGLVLDPALDTTYIIEALVYQLPGVTENLGQARGLASGLASKGSINLQERVQLSTLIGQIDSESEAMDKILTLAIAEIPTLSQQLDQTLLNKAAAMESFIETINQEILFSNVISSSSDNIFQLGTAAIDANAQLYQILAPVLEQLLQNRIEQLNQQRMMLSLVIIVALAIALYLFAGFYKATLEMISRLVTATTQIADGDLTTHVAAVAKDETGQIIEALNKMTINLNNVVMQLRNNAALLATASEELSFTTLQAKNNSMNQQSQSEQIATAMTEMASTVKEIARNAELLDVEVRNTQTDIGSSETVISDTVKSINKLTDGVANAVKAIQELTQSSNEIGSVLTVITGVAEQTNLLALNAAIEAARAGEHGRGFAVVADEVRTLATRTQQSASQIQVMVDNLQQRTQQAATIMNQEKENALGMTHYTQSVTQSIQNMVGAMTHISDMSTQVASAAEQQGFVCEEINRNVTYVSDLSLQNLNGSEQITVASHELAQLAAELDSIVKRFKV